MPTSTRSRRQGAYGYVVGGDHRQGQGPGDRTAVAEKMPGVVLVLTYLNAPKQGASPTGDPSSRATRSCISASRSPAWWPRPSSRPARPPTGSSPTMRPNRVCSTSGRRARKQSCRTRARVPAPYPADSTGRRNTPIEEVAMSIRKRRSDRSGRAPLPSPGRPPVAGRDEQRRFWAAIATGMASEDAAVEAGVSQAVGTRWFRKAGGMPPAMFGALGEAALRAIPLIGGARGDRASSCSGPFHA